MSKTEKQKMLAGELYRPGDHELQADAAANKAWLARYNAALAAAAARCPPPAVTVAMRIRMGQTLAE